MNTEYRFPPVAVNNLTTTLSPAQSTWSSKGKYQAIAPVDNDFHFHELVAAIYMPGIVKEGIQDVTDQTLGYIYPDLLPIQKAM